MNTGLLLKKAGESPYSRYRRFLISNYGSYKTATQIRKALLQEQWGVNRCTLEKLSTPEIAKKLEKENIINLGLSPSLPNGSIVANFRPIKHCQSCTEICYHSNLFELPWIMKCPYHGIPLTAKCSQCERELPPSSNLLATLCSSCGTRISIERISSISGKIDVDGYKIFEELEDIYTVNRSLFPIMYFVDRNQFILNRKHANENSSFYPSVLERYDKSFRSLDRGITKGVVHYYEVGVEDYDINIDNSELKSDTDFTLKLDVAKKVTNRIKNFLTKIKGKGHPLGHCFRQRDTHTEKDLNLVNYLTDSQWESNFCKICKVFCIWNNLIPFPIRGELPSYYNQKKVTNLIEQLLGHLDHLKLNFPEVIRYINIDKHRENPIKIPNKMAEKIYELDLWCTFIYLFNILSVIDAAHSENREGNSSIKNLITSFSFESHLSFCPYYIKKTKNIWSLNYPKILDKDILDSKLVKLLSF